jgi:hypothetical protein
MTLKSRRDLKTFYKELRRGGHIDERYRLTN